MQKLSLRKRLVLRAAQRQVNAALSASLLDSSKGAAEAIVKAQGMELTRRATAHSFLESAQYDATPERFADMAKMREWKIGGRVHDPEEPELTPVSVRHDMRMDAEAKSLEYRGVTRNGRPVGPVMAPKRNTMARSKKTMVH